MKLKLLFNLITPFATSKLKGKSFRNLLVLFMMVVGVNGVMGQVSLTSTGSPITIDFSTAVSGVCSTNVASTSSSAMMASTPAAGQLDSDAWAFVTDAATSGAAASFPGSLTASFTTYTTAGSSNTGWGISNISSDRELAILPSGSSATPGSITLLITNNTGVTLNELVISYNVRAYNDQGRSNKVEFWYSATNVASSYTENTAAEFTSTETLSSSFEGVSRTVTLTSLSIANNSSYYIRWFFDDVAGSGSRDEFHLDDISITGNVSSSPTVIATGTLTPFISSSISSTSSEQSFTVSGSNLTNDIVITPPTGYQISTSTGGSFSPTNPITLTQSSGSVATTTIYARFNPTALVDQVGGNIAITSTGATTQNVAVSGEVTNLSAGAIAFIAFQGQTTDLYRIVALNDIPNNTRIWFTDKSWDGGTSSFYSGEGNNVWTNTTGSAIAAGTVIQFDALGGATFGTGGLNSGLGSAGEQLFAYQGTLTSPTFVAGYTSGTVITTGATTSTATYVPAGLTSGTNFVALEGITFGSSYVTAATHNRSLADMRSHIHTFANLTTGTSTPTDGNWPTYTFNIIADEPTTQPSFSAATAVDNNQMDLNFSGGNGTSYMVVMREASAVSATPTDATNYSLVSGTVNFALATELSAGQKIVYNGTISTGTVTVTNLSAGTDYHYAIYAYNGTTTKANFYLTSPGTGNQLTIAAPSNNWTGANGNWNTAGNWSLATVPSSSDNITISSGSPVMDVDVTIPAGKSLTLSDSGSLIVAPGKVLTIAGTANFGARPVTFKSDATGTAMLGPLTTGTLAGATSVTVERFIPSGKRAFRLLSPAVTTTTFISGNWQQQTHITGGASGGFDATETNNPSMYTYDNQAVQGVSGWTPIANTNATNLTAGVGYRVLIRGDKTPTNITSASADNMNAAITLSATGTLKTGTVPLSSSSTPSINNTTNSITNGYSLVGNPYQSAVDWHLVTKTGIEETYYAWAPNMGTGTARGNYVAYNVSTGNSGGGSVGQFIQPGQAFFVKNTGSSAGTLTFEEAHKATTSANVFRTANTPTLAVALYDPNELAIGGYPIDATKAVFSAEYTNELGLGDAAKLEAAGENIAWFRNNTKLAIDAAAPVTTSDELVMKTLRLGANKNYTFKIQTTNFDTALTPYLVDTFLNTQTAISTSEVYLATFSTTSNTASYGEDRFKIVFQTSALTTDDFVKNIKLYPNPAKAGGSFYIDGITEATVSVYNVVGQNIPVTVMSQGSAIQVTPSASLSKGVYLVSITTQGVTKQIKWIVE